jgi:hypothetical protein
MKNLTAFSALIAFLTLSFSDGTMAQCGRMAGGPGLCAASPTVSPEVLQKFNKETKALQEQLIDKQASLKKEFLKDDPDPDAIASIKIAIIGVEKEIQKVAKKLGIKNCYGSCSMFMGNGCGMGCGGGGMRSGGKECRGHEGGNNQGD